VAQSCWGFWRARDGGGIRFWSISRGVVSRISNSRQRSGKFDLAGLMAREPCDSRDRRVVAAYLALFDTVGTLVGVGHRPDCSRKGSYRVRAAALFADAAGTTMGARSDLYCKPATSTSAAGVSDGARTGLANMVTGTLLLLAMFFSPLASMIGEASVVGGDAAGHPIVRYPTLAPALIGRGAMMLRSCGNFSGTIRPSIFPPS